jgi:hypothetical protein
MITQSRVAFLATRNTVTLHVRGRAITLFGSEIEEALCILQQSREEAKCGKEALRHVGNFS